MKKPAVHEIVFSRQFPKPKQNEPQTFYAHVQRNLVPEVRVEVQTFYGALDSPEAQYPGLDYSYEPHRRRLGRFPWHRRLFRIFDELRLTNDEILSICQWEGTKSAKDKYEAETGRKIRDTTSDGVIIPQKCTPKAVIHHQPIRRYSTETVAQVGTMDSKTIDVEESDDDEIDNSVGVQLNDQLMAVAEGDLPGDGPLEEWLKYMNERDADRGSMLQAIRAGQPPPTVLERLRAGNDMALGTSEAVASSSSRDLPPLQSIATSSEQAYGPTTEEILAAL